MEGSIAEELAEAVRHSVTKKTWASYRTAERMLAKYLMDNGRRMELPVEEGTLLGFIHWLAYVKRNSAATIMGYLAGIRKLHIIKGIEEPKLRTEMVNMILDGRKHIKAGGGDGGQADCVGGVLGVVSRWVQRGGADGEICLLL